MYQIIVWIIFILLIVTSVNGARFFHHGRVRGGNLQLRVEPKLDDSRGNKNFTRWFNQTLDHFDVGNLAAWYQRYYVNDQFFDHERRNVAFLMLGGESEATDNWMINGDWVDYANQSKALMFQLEHRFYGESRPTEDVSLENLRYLTSEQALADIATFVDAMNNEYKLSKKVKWIAFGGSYSGSLAAWARLKYPRLIDGSVCTSGPSIAVPNFQDYFQVVADDLRNTDEKCHRAVKVGTAQIKHLMRHRVGQRNLTSLFQLCDPLEESVKNKEDISNFYSNLATNFAVIAQYNKANRLSTIGTLLGNITLDTICDIMTNTSIEHEIARLSEVNSLILKAFNESCFAFKYKPMIEELRNVTWEESQGGRQWIFQTCNEFGFYQTSDKKPQIFGDKFPLEFFVKQCIDIFGSQFNGTYLDSATHRTNKIYGTDNIELTNIVFVHGSVDPWSTLGTTSTQNQNITTIFINGTAHCANMYPPLEDDLPQLKAARVQVGQLIQLWLK